MSVKFTQQAEVERIEREQNSWALYSTSSLVRAARRARELGWANKKVQLREERVGDTYEYHIEPYEEGCGCRGLLRYEDFFGVPFDSDDEG